MPAEHLTYSAGVIRAIVFDFNGVIADDETPHFLCFQQALAETGLTLSKNDYYGTYMGMDERTCTRLLLEQRDGVSDETQVLRITERKTELFGAYTASHKPSLFPDVVEFVLAAKTRYRLAIASGGRRTQIEDALAGSAIEHAFDVIVTAEDCSTGKPHPAIYLMTWDRLNSSGPPGEHVRSSECLVIEDSLAGITSARAAGMRVVAVSTTYPFEKLSEAEHVFQGFHDVTPEAIIGALALSSPRSRSSALWTPSKDE